MSEIGLVTCLYSGLHGTKFGGRPGRDTMYRQSLATICRTGLPVHCFISSTDDVTENFFSDIPNITFIKLDLTEIKYHQDIQRIKSQNVNSYMDVFWQNRCAEIMYGKMTMLKIVGETHQYNTMFWIDAGLSRSEIISPKYFNADDLKHDLYYNAFKLFTPDLFNRILKYTSGKLLILESTCPDNVPIPQKYNTLPYTTSNGCVAGIFGGPIQLCRKLITAFDEKVEATILNNELFSEESILSGILADHPDWFKAFTFTSFYHEGWGERHNPSLINYSNFFDELFLSN